MTPRLRARSGESDRKNTRLPLADFLPIYRLTRHTPTQVVHFAVDRAVLWSGGTQAAERPLTREGIRFPIWGRSHVHALSIDVAGGTLPLPLVLELTLIHYDAGNADLPARTVLTAQAAIPAGPQGLFTISFPLGNTALTDDEPYVASVRLVSGDAGGCAVRGAVGALLLPPLAAEQVPVTRREPGYRLRWREAGGRFHEEAPVLRDGAEALVPVTITIQESLGFEFIAPAETIDELELLIAPNRGQSSIPLQLEVWSSVADFPVLRSVRTMPRPEAYFQAFDLRGVPFVPGARYRVLVSSPTPPGETPNKILAGHAAQARAVQGTAVFDGLDDPLRLYAERTRRRAAGRLRAGVVVPEGCPNAGATLQALARRFPYDVLETLTVSGPAWGLQLPRLMRFDTVLFVDPPAAPGTAAGAFDQTVHALHAAMVCTVHVASGAAVLLPAEPNLRLDSPLSRTLFPAAQTARRCHHQLTVSADGTVRAPSGEEVLADGLAGLREGMLRQALPHVAVVTVLYRKAAMIPAFVNAMLAQSYGGRISVVAVDDASPDGSTEALERCLAENAARVPGNLTFTMLRNEANAGNCASRNRGIKAVTADLYVVMDCDCVVNAHFIAAHALEHRQPDVGVVVGPMNIETLGRHPLELIEQIEAQPSPPDREMELQDPVQRDGFLNCITRNISVKAELIARLSEGRAGPFDEDFSYREQDGTGFGWEDVEFGSRLYRAGAGIRFTGRAVSVHVTHPPSIDDVAKTAGLMRNFNLLFRKHPDLALEARRWATATAANLMEAADRLGLAGHPERRALGRRFGAAVSAPALRTAARRPLRILSYRWHCGHQYELYKLPHQFTLIRGLGPGMTRDWDREQRPLPRNVSFKDVDRINLKDYDAAILHFDENVLAPNLSAGVLPPDWGDAFRWFLDNVSLPRVAVCHGTPAFVGQYDMIRRPIARFMTHEPERRQLVDALARVPVVVNAWQALDQWGFADARVIWHGFDPQQYGPARHERDVLGLGAALWERPHYRGAYEFEAVLARLPQDVRVETPFNQDAGLLPRGGDAYAESRFRGYVARLREFTAYLNTTLRSPMPRSRAEAMMCGVVPVCLRNYDVELFIRHGIDGFYADEPEELADYLVHLCRNRDAARRIGAQARRTAMDLFNHDRYLAHWTALLNEVAG